MLKFYIIVAGGMQSRGRDDWSSGQPEARRGDHVHRDIDIVCKNGQEIFSQIDCEVIREAFHYKHDTSYRGVLIEGVDQYVGYTVKLFYMNCLFLGRVDGGGLVGYAQNIEMRYPGIINHVHMEMYRLGVLVDPRDLYLACF